MQGVIISNIPGIEHLEKGCKLNILASRQLEVHPNWIQGGYCRSKMVAVTSSSLSIRRRPATRELGYFHVAKILHSLKQF